MSWLGILLHQLLLHQDLFLALYLAVLRDGGVNQKKFSFGHCPNKGGGVYPCLNFVALFQEVYFWSIKRAYFFKNVNTLNLFFRLLAPSGALIAIPTYY